MGELGAEVLASFKVPLTLEAIEDVASRLSLRFSVGPALLDAGLLPTLTATMFLPLVVKNVLLRVVDIDVEGAMMTKVGPLLVLGIAVEVVADATTSGSEGVGGLGDDLNLLSRMESNSASCSMVLDDMDLTIVCPSAIFSVDDPRLAEVAGIGDVVAAELVTTVACTLLMPKACGGTVTKRLPCLIIHLPVALWTSTCLSPHC